MVASGHPTWSAQRHVAHLQSAEAALDVVCSPFEQLLAGVHVDDEVVEIRLRL